MKKKSGMIFAACYIAYTSIYVARMNLSVASPVLISRSVLDTVQLGFLGSIFSVIYASGRLINGQLGDRRSPCFMIAAGLALAGLSNLALGMLPPFAGIALLWGLNAYGQSMLWSSMLVVMSRLYDGQVAKRRSAALVTTVATGNLLGIIINTALIEKLGSEFAFIVPGSLNLIICALIVFTIRGIKEVDGGREKKHENIFRLLKQPDIRKQLVPALANGTIKENITLWMTVFFVDSFQIDLSALAGFVLFVPLFGMLGRALYSSCFRLLGSDENKLSLGAFALCVFFTFPMCFSPSAVTAALCLSALYALCSLANTSIVSIFPHRFSYSSNLASVSGLMDFAAYIGAGLSAAVYGVVVENFGYRPMYVSWIFISALSIWRLYALVKNEPAPCNE